MRHGRGAAIPVILRHASTILHRSPGRPWDGTLVNLDVPFSLPPEDVTDVKLLGMVHRPFGHPLAVDIVRLSQMIDESFESRKTNSRDSPSEMRLYLGREGAEGAKGWPKEDCTYPNHQVKCKAYAVLPATRVEAVCGLYLAPPGCKNLFTGANRDLLAAIFRDGRA